MKPFCLSLLGLSFCLCGFLKAEDGRGEHVHSKEKAAALMAAAHRQRAVWDEFPGFTADLSVNANQLSVEGQLTVKADGTVEVNLPNVPEVEWVEDRLQSLVGHRQPAEVGRYDVEFADKDADHPNGRLIKLGDKLHSTMRIKGDVITEVHRDMGETRFSITVMEITRNAEAKYLPKTYSVGFWDSDSGNLKRSATYHNDWKRVGQLDLPEKVLVVSTADDGEYDVRQIRLFNHELLSRE